MYIENADTHLVNITVTVVRPIGHRTFKLVYSVFSAIFIWASVLGYLECWENIG